MLRNLGNNSVATENTRDDVVEHIVEGIIPWRDDTEDTIRDVFNVGSLMSHHGTNGPKGWLKPLLAVEVDTPDLLTGSHDLTEQCINLLACLERTFERIYVS